jgi:hypothetical protein
MTTNDTTGDKLVASIRRTKTAAAPATDPAAPVPPAPRRQATRATNKAETSPPAPRPSEARDTYRSAGRVWPD